MRRYFYVGIAGLYGTLFCIGIFDHSGLEALTGVAGAFAAGLLAKSHWRKE